MATDTKKLHNIENSYEANFRTREMIRNNKKRYIMTKGLRLKEDSNPNSVKHLTIEHPDTRGKPDRIGRRKRQIHFHF